jgi:hypothetical protein
MPFRQHLDEVYDVIRRVLGRLAIDCVRGDQISQAGLVMDQIREQIEQADLVICDLTEGNPNVFFETGIAIELKSKARVILLAPEGYDVPFDLKTLRYIAYPNNRLGRRRLAAALERAVSEVVRAPWNRVVDFIGDRLERTRRIIAETTALAARAEKQPAIAKGLIVRIYAALSSLAITDAEGKDTEGSMLVDEREAIMRLLRCGATVRAILTPPQTEIGRPVLVPRIERLIDLLDRTVGNHGGRAPSRRAQGARRLNKDVLGPQCHFAISPILGSNVYILGNKVLFQGMKADLSRHGYGFTLRIETHDLVEAHIQAFDQHFSDAVAYTMSRWPGSSSPANPDKKLRQSVLAGLREHRDRLKSSSPFEA